MAVAVLAVLGLAVAGVFALRDGGGSDDPTARPAGAQSSASSAEASGPLTIEAVEPSAPVELPPPDRIRITSIGVDSALETLDIDAAGALHAPKDYAKAGWFGKGPAPGDIGPAVIAGHVDSQTGPAVFYQLRDLKPGDLVEVSRGGQWIGFRVTASERYPKDQFPTAKVYSPTPVPELRLITCGGTFDRSRRSYEDNIVVYALPATS
jgi:hypothetical protein